MAIIAITTSNSISENAFREMRCKGVDSFIGSLSAWLLFDLYVAGWFVTSQALSLTQYPLLGCQSGKMIVASSFGLLFHIGWKRGALIGLTIGFHPGVSHLRTARATLAVSGFRVREHRRTKSDPKR